jgi:hypothetical protein
MRTLPTRIDRRFSGHAHVYQHNNDESDQLPLQAPIWLPTGCSAKLTLELCASRRAFPESGPKFPLIIRNEHAH